MIELVTGPNALVNAVVSGAMLAFGIWVLTLTPRTRSTLLLAAFAIAAGAIHVPGSLTRWTGWERFAVWLPYRALVFTVGGLALLGLARTVVEPLGRRGRRLWSVALGVVTAMVVLPSAISVLTGLPGTGVLADWQVLSAAVHDPAVRLFFHAFLAVGIVLVWTHRHPAEGLEEATRVRTALTSAALVLWPAFQAGASVTALADPDLGPVRVATVAPAFAAWVLLAALWLANARAVPQDSRRARNVALVILVAMLAGMVNRAYVEPLFAPADDPFFDLVRLLTVLILGYAILRHQVLGIDARFRWGVSKTTVAGVFVAVFFVVSEGAQVLFAGFAGSELLGIVAAGALLFALSPIQKLADRIAEKAVPSTPDGAPATVGGPTPRAEAAYKETLRKFLSDDALSRDEEKALADLAGELGIDAGRAFELREEVEDEMAAPGGEAA